jgi:pyridoxal 5'-phosphate synthase pdxS subunit
MSEPTVVPSSNALPTTAGANANGSSTPVVIHRGVSSAGAGGSSGTFGVKTGLAQMLKGG